MPHLLVVMGPKDQYLADMAAAVQAGRLAPDRHPGLAELDELLDLRPTFAAWVQAAGHDRASVLRALRGSTQQRNRLRTDMRAAAEAHGYTRAQADTVLLRLYRKLQLGDAGQWEEDRWRSPVNGRRWLLHWVAELSDLEAYGGHTTWTTTFDGVRAWRAGGTVAFASWLAQVRAKWDARLTDPDWVNWGTDVLQVLPTVQALVPGTWPLLDLATDMPSPQ